MNPLLVLLAAMVISMAVIPLMLRLAPRVGLLDLPAARKVHAVPVARVGGWGITVGALLPLAWWLPTDPLLASYLLGSAILFAFGAVDDRYNIGHYQKFVGQILAVVPVVYVGDLYVERLPFLAPGALDEDLARAFTVFAMVGMINAINHSDGLDGLAGGESLLSLLVIAVLALLHLQELGAAGLAVQPDEVASALVVVLLCMAAIGGLLGFLRFNAHPARVFMGDTGSQFLGFTLGFLAVLLTQRVDTSLGAALPALLLGLPVADILVVFYLRVRAGMNWFRGTRNHVHHRLLDLGFSHFECVVIIYSVQAIFVTCAVFARHAHDAVILGLYLGGCAALFALLALGERRGARGHTARAGGALHAAATPKMAARLRDDGLLHAAPLWLLAAALPVYFLGGSAQVAEVPWDFGLISMLLLALLLLETVLGGTRQRLAQRLCLYTAATFVVYLTLPESREAAQTFLVLEQAFFVLLALAVALAIRFAPGEEFRLSPTDYLILFVVLGIALVSAARQDTGVECALVVKAVILLYACELLFSRMHARNGYLSLVAMSTLAVLSLRGLAAS